MRWTTATRIYPASMLAVEDQTGERGRMLAPPSHLLYSVYMHVVIATGLYPPEIGGPATFSSFFEHELKARNIPCTVIPFSAVRHFPRVIRHIVYFFRVLGAIRRGSTVLALDPVSVGLPALFAAHLRGAAFYLRAGGDYAWEQAVQRWGFKGPPEEFPGDTPLPIMGRLLVWTERHVARRARRILTQSGHLASVVTRWGVAREHIVVIPNGVARPSLPPREKLRDEFGWGSDPVVVSAGRFVPWKGFSALMDAVASLKSDFPDIRLCIAGGGPDEKTLRAHAVTLSARTEFLGSLSKDALAHVIHAADVFALNTRYEGFSHQIAEAFVLGTPVVTTDIGGNKDLAENEKTALTVPFDDVSALAGAIRRLLSDREFSKRIADGAQAHVRSFTPERTFRETCQAIGITLEKA